MKRAFIDIPLMELAQRLGVKEGVELSHVEQMMECWPLVRLHLRGEGLPDNCDMEDGMCSYGIPSYQISEYFATQAIVTGGFDTGIPWQGQEQFEAAVRNVYGEALTKREQAIAKEILQ